MKLLLALCAALLLTCSAQAQPPACASVVDASRLNAEALSLTRYFSVLEDREARLSLAQVQTAYQSGRFAPCRGEGESMNLGFSPSAYWLRLELENASAQPLERMLEIAYARLGPIELHQVRADGSTTRVRTGITTAFSTRPYPNRFFVFPLTLPAQATQVLFLRVQSTSSVLIPARLWTPQAFHAYERQDYSAQAWYYGLASAMLLFNLLLYFTLKDRNYLLYVGFVLSTALTLAAEHGLGDEFLWSNALRWSVIASMVGYSISSAFILQFMRRMLDMAATAPRFDRLLRILIAVLLLSPIGFAFAFSALLAPFVVLYVFMAVVILWVAVRGTLRRQRAAYFFLGAFGALALGGILYASRTLGWLPTNGLTVRGLQIGSALEMLLLSFALADRYNVMRRDRESFQEQALRAKGELVETLRRSERLLEERVDERTCALQQLNHQLEALSATDGLTGVANRRHFDKVLAVEWARAARAQQPLALIMADVDWFKNYNDHYGHQAGDLCLQEIARMLAATANRVSAALAALALPHAGSALGVVTISLGVASMVPTDADSECSLIALADQALYRAKAQGRNRVVLA